MTSRTKKILKILLLVVLLGAILTSFAFAAGEDEAAHVSLMYGTAWSLLPPILAIVLALITKEVYSSLIIGIILGALFYANFNIEIAINAVFFSDGGIVTSLSDSYNMGIMAFLVMLGILVALMNKAGGSAAFGRWAGKHIKSRVGAQICTVILGVLIFVDDYFNCLTVGSVMRPITDRHNISRAKLSYIIDATAAPVCIIAPVSSWAAAVTSYIPEGSGINGFLAFIKTIPFNLYAILTIVMMLCLALMKFDFGTMKRFEDNAKNGDLFTTPDRPYGNDIGEADVLNERSSLWDLVAPVLVLIAACIVGLAYTGGWFSGVSFIEAFSAADASMGLVLGGAIALVFTFIYYMIRRIVSFKEFFDSFAEGFKAMVPAMLILTFAWSLAGMTKYCLGSSDFVSELLRNAGALKNFIPVVLFLLACGIAFATGTSWGTFGILIPIVCGVFDASDPMLIIAISASMGGAVMGDHCSPISDTTIMASAGAHCNHVDHVSTQLPYACTVAAVCAVGYILAAFVHTAWVVTPVCIVLLIAILLLIKSRQSKKARV